MSAVAILMGMALLTMVVAPLRDDLAAWAWGWWLLAALAAFALGPRRPLPVLRRTMAPAVLCLLAACLIDLAMGAWHREGWNTMRQDGKVLLILPIIWALMGATSPAAGSSRLAQGHAGHIHGLNLREALGWALGLQLLVAAAVAFIWPRAWLPATSIPWATALALGMAVLAPLVLGNDEGEPAGAAWRMGLALAVAAGAVAVVLSRSRAAWVVLPWLMVLVVVFSRNRLRASLGALGVAAALLGAGLWYDSQQPVQVERGVRLLDLLQELASAGQPDAGTSVGSRLLLWQAAWESLWAGPWAGIGLAERVALVQRVVPPEQLSGVAPLVHVHQQFLNQAVDHGLAGLAASLLCAAAPWALAWRAQGSLMRWQFIGIGVVHTVGLMFNANMTHGTYAMHYALSLGAVLLMHGHVLRKGPHG